MDVHILNDAVQDLEELDGFGEKEDAELVQIAQTLLQSCITLCEEVVERREDGHAKAYIVDHLKIFASSDHGFLSDSFNLEKWRNGILAIEDGEE